MAIQLETPKHITTLRDCAMQGSLEIRMWLGTTQDEQLSDEVTESKQAERGSAKVVKNLLAGCAEHEGIKRYRSRVYNWFKENTYPYTGTSRLLGNYDIPAIMQEYEDDVRPKFFELVDNFCVAYTAIKSNYAFRMQGQMYNANDYPDVDLVRAKFGMDMYLQPIGSSDFGQHISAQVAEQLNTHYARQAERFIQETGDRQLAQLTKVMQSLSHCCEVDIKQGDNGETKVTRRRLHESTLLRAIEYCDSFAHFNPSGSNKLEGIRSDLARVLQGVNIDTLRESDSLRATVKSEVDDIMKKFGI
jgi:hypothetical protein